MEFEYQDNSRRRAKLVIVIGAVTAVAAGALAFLAINQARQQAQVGGATLVPVVVAQTPISARKPIEAAEIVLRELPADATNEQGVFTDPDAVVGLIATVPILAGQPIYANMLASGTSTQGLAILEPGETVTEDSEAWRAVSLTVPDDRAVGGLVQAGDIVDVFVTTSVTVPEEMALDGKYMSDKSTKITYQNVKILQRATTYYVLRVSLEVAEEISHLQAAGSGTFSLALRPVEDTRVADATSLGETTSNLIERYGLPIPEVYPGSGPIAARPAPTPSPTPTPSPSGSPVLEPGPSPLP